MEEVGIVTIDALNIILESFADVLEIAEECLTPLRLEAEVTSLNRARALLGHTLALANLEWVLDNYKVGSRDWSWDEEFADVSATFDLTHLTASIAEDGIRDPIIVGDDGRVWDGHKRLTIANELQISEVPISKSF